MPKEDGQFTEDNARAMAARSAIARRPIDKEGAATRSHKYAEHTMDLIYERIAAPAKCEKCGRGGPSDARLFASLVKSLLAAIELIQKRAWGVPATESKFGRQASLDDFKRGQREVLSEGNKDFVPTDLPPAPG